MARTRPPAPPPPFPPLGETLARLAADGYVLGVHHDARDDAYFVGSVRRRPGIGTESIRLATTARRDVAELLLNAFARVLADHRAAVAAAPTAPPAPPPTDREWRRPDWVMPDTDEVAAAAWNALSPPVGEVAVPLAVGCSYAGRTTGPARVVNGRAVVAVDGFGDLPLYGLVPLKPGARDAIPGPG